MDTSSNLTNFDFGAFLSTNEQFPEESDASGLSFFRFPSSNSTFQSTYQAHHLPPQVPGGRYHVNSHTYGGHVGPQYLPKTPSAQRECYFMRLSPRIRFKIYKYALEVDAPHRVFVHHSREWRNTHLTQGESIQHTAAVIKVDLKATAVTRVKVETPNGPKIEQMAEHRRLYFTLREYSQEETKSMSRSLWPSLLRVSQSVRNMATTIFYQNAHFTAPSDPWTIPEWEARLPIEALKYLSQNKRLLMEHICCEAQQWRCLRNYLYNPFRQPYTVVNPERLTKYWPSAEITLRGHLASIPWMFVQLYTVDEQYNHPSILNWNSRLAPEHGLHEVLHSEFLAEVQRIHRIRNREDREGQLYHLAHGLWNFFDKLGNLVEFDGFVALAHWLENWLMDPLMPVPEPLYSSRYPGGLFFGLHLWEHDIMQFVKEYQKYEKNKGR